MDSDELTVPKGAAKQLYTNKYKHTHLMILTTHELPFQELNNVIKDITTH